MLLYVKALLRPSLKKVLNVEILCRVLKSNGLCRSQNWEENHACVTKAALRLFINTARNTTLDQAHKHHRRHCHCLYMTSSPAKLGTHMSPEYTPLTIQQRNNNRKCIYTERVGAGLCLRLSQAANGMR